jgi:hypothetical protein
MLTMMYDVLSSDRFMTIKTNFLPMQSRKKNFE